METKAEPERQPDETGQIIQEIKKELVPDLCNVVWLYAVDSSILFQFVVATRADDVYWLNCLEHIHHIDRYMHRKTFERYCDFMRSLMKTACEYSAKRAIQWILNEYIIWRTRIWHPKDSLLGGFEEYVVPIELALAPPPYPDTHLVRHDWERGLCEGNYKLREWLLRQFEDMENEGALVPRPYSFEEDFLWACAEDGIHSIRWFIQMETQRPEIKLDYSRALAWCVYDGDMERDRIRAFKYISFMARLRPDFAEIVAGFKAENKSEISAFDHIYDIPAEAAFPWLDVLLELTDPKTDYGWGLRPTLEKVLSQGWGEEQQIEPVDEESGRAYTKAVLFHAEKDLRASLNTTELRKSYIPLPGQKSTNDLLVLRTAIQFGGKQIARQCQKLFGITFTGSELPQMPDIELLD